jgi:parallel beta-helix repeat protein
LVLILVGVLGLKTDFQRVEASPGIIYIRADGSIEGTTYIASDDNVTYFFTAGINGSIIVQRSNIIIDGNGFTLQWSEQTDPKEGFHIYEVNNVTIRNTTIQGFDYGVRLYHSLKDNIHENNVMASNYLGIFLDESSHNNITGNNLAANSGGLYLRMSSNNTISGNNIVSNSYGIWLDGSSDNTLRNNTIANNTYNFGVWGGFWNDADVSNTVNGKPVYYWIDKQDLNVPADAGYIILVNCTCMKVQNLLLSNNGEGLLLVYTKNSIIINNTIANNEFGVRLHNSMDNCIYENDLIANDHAIWLYGSLNNSVHGNNIANNGDGIRLFQSSTNDVAGNNITSYNSFGIKLLESSNNDITRNYVTANDEAGIDIAFSSGNTIFKNNIIANSLYGIRLYKSSSNVIYHNNLIENTEQVYMEVAGYANAWNSSYPLGGNYWSNYNGTDLYSGSYQNETGSDGIGDTEYAIDGNNTDHYPLMGIFSSFNASIWYGVDVVSNSTIEDFEYFESNSTITLHVSNMTVSQTKGFCRLTIPHGLMSPLYTITINGTQVSYTSIFENGTLSIIYFSYEHSELEIVIIPEFPSFLILPLFMTATLLAIIVYKNKAYINTR